MPRPKKVIIAKLNFFLLWSLLQRISQLLVRTNQCCKNKLCLKLGYIVFEHVPSVASSRYQKAFERNAPHYQKFIEQLEQGTTTVNAGTLFPHDVIRSNRTGNETVSQAQWDSLPDYVDGNEATILPMVDVSGLLCPVSGANSVTCMDALLVWNLCCNVTKVYERYDYDITDIPKLWNIQEVLLKESIQNVEKM